MLERRRRGCAAAASSSSSALRGVAQRVERAVDLAGAELGVERDDDQRRRRRPGSGSTCSPAPVISARVPRQHHRDVGAEAHRAARAGSRRPEAGRGEPQRGGGVARAAGHPGRDRDPLGDRQRAAAARPSRSRRGTRASARSGEVLALDARADHACRASPRRSPASPRRRAASGWTSETSGCSPSARGAPTSRQRLTLPGASVLSTAAPTARASRRARATRRGRRRGGRAPRAPRGCARGCPAPRSGASESERASALRRWAKPCWTSVRRLCRRRRAVAAQADEHGVDVRDRVEDAARDLA